MRFDGLSVSFSDVYKEMLEGHSETITSAVVRGDTSVIAEELNSYLRTVVSQRFSEENELLLLEIGA